MKTLLILLVLCCQGDKGVDIATIPREIRRDVLRDISECCVPMNMAEHARHCCVQRVHVKHGLQDKVCADCQLDRTPCPVCGLSCWECRVREALELSEHKHEKEKTMKPCALCTSRIEKMSTNEEHPLFLVRATGQRSTMELQNMSQGIKEAFPDNFKFIFTDSTVDFEKLDDARLAEIGLQRIAKPKGEKENEQ